MKLTVFGATGGVGQCLVELALREGHTVRAVTRHPEKLVPPRTLLSVERADVLNSKAVTEAVRGSDAVLCALGMPLLDRQRLRAKGTTVIVDAMTACGVTRLVCLSAFGAGDSRRQLPPLHRYVLRPTIMRRLYADHDAQEKIVEQSGLDWTLVRPGSFVSDDHSGPYWHGLQPGLTRLTYKISRADVADFMLRQLSDETYLRRAPGLSYASGIAIQTDAPEV